MRHLPALSYSFPFSAAFPPFCTISLSTSASSHSHLIHHLPPSSCSFAIFCYASLFPHLPTRACSFTLSSSSPLLLHLLHRSCSFQFPSSPPFLFGPLPAPAPSDSPLLFLFCFIPFPAPFHSPLLYHLPLRFSLFQFPSLLFFCSASFLFRSFLSGIQCRSGWLNHGSSCYHFSHDQETWINAEVRSINIKRFPFDSYIFTITLSHTLLYTKQCKVKLAYRIYYVLSIVKINRKFSCYFS